MGKRWVFLRESKKKEKKGMQGGNDCLAKSDGGRFVDHKGNRFGSESFLLFAIVEGAQSPQLRVSAECPST